MVRVLQTDGQPAPEEWITVREAAQHLGIPEYRSGGGWAAVVGLAAARSKRVRVCDPQA